MSRPVLDRPGLIAVIAAAVLGVLILSWPPLERDNVADGLLPEGQRPRLLNAAAPTLEASAAARMIAFSPTGAAPPSAEGPVAAAPTAPAPPPVDLTPLLVGVSGTDAAPVGYFSSKGQTYRARRGEKIDGWTVVVLSRRQARLAKGGRRLTTTLFASRAGPLSPPMATAASGSTNSAPTESNPGQTAVATPSPTTAGPAPPPPGVRKRKPLPPLPPGSKGYWAGPKGEQPPPGYTRIPDQ
jgi:hypothetical protein